MIVIDANLLLYAYDAKSPNHGAARSWLESVFSGTELVALPLQNVAAFLRIVTNVNLPGERFTPEEAVKIVDGWLRLPNVQLLIPGQRHWSLLRTLIIEGQTRGPLITDAQLAALTIEFGGTLYTTDRDFMMFDGLRSRNPVSPPDQSGSRRQERSGRNPRKGT